MTIRVEELTASDDSDLTGFLNRLGKVTPSVLGYHYPFYRDLLVEAGAGKPVYLGARLHGDLVGFLPAFVRESSAGIVYSSLPYFGPNAGVLCGDHELRAEIHAVLLRALLERADQDAALSCSIYTPFMFDRFDLYDTALPGATVVNKFTLHLDVTTFTPSKGIAYDLRRTKQLGVEVSKDITAQRVEDFYLLYEQNCRDYGIPLKSKRCVESLLREDILGQHTDIYFAFHREKLVAGLLMIWSPLTASYYIPCTLAGARALQPSTLLIDQAVQDARARGIQLWNWESSPSRESGVYQFKKKWGSIEGTYRIYLQTFRPHETFRCLGREGILRHFPFYFVYSFNQL